MVHFSMESTLMLAEGDEAKAFAREKSDKEHKELDFKSTSQGTSVSIGLVLSLRLPHALLC